MVFTSWNHKCVSSLSYVPLVEGSGGGVGEGADNRAQTDQVSPLSARPEGQV